MRVWHAAVGIPGVRFLDNVGSSSADKDIDGMTKEQIKDVDLVLV